MDLSGADIDFLTVECPQAFTLIKNLWTASEDPNNLPDIRSNYGVEKISKVLTFKNVVAVKGAVAVLLDLSLSDAYVDFFNDIFYENVLDALRKERNNALYWWIGRLIRLLQINKPFGDWILTKGATVEENKLWNRFAQLSETDDEVLKKESSRLVKEGMRVGVREGEWCIIPPATIKRMRTDFFWRIKDEDAEQLQTLSQETLDDAGWTIENLQEKRRLEDENSQIRQVYGQRIQALEKELETQQQEKNKSLAALNTANRSIKEAQNNLTDPQLSGTISSSAQVGHLLSSNPALGRLLATNASGTQLVPLAKSFAGVSGIAPMKKAVASLLQDVNVLAAESASLSKKAEESFDGVNELKREDRETVQQLAALRQELPQYLSSALAAYEDNIRAALLGKPVAIRPLNQSMSLGRSVVGLGDDALVNRSYTSLNRSAQNLSSTYGSASYGTPRGGNAPLAQTYSGGSGARLRGDKHFGPSSSSPPSNSLSLSQSRYIPGTPPSNTPVSASAFADEVLPFGWSRKFDQRTSHFYYFNQATGKTQWTVPVE